MATKSIDVELLAKMFLAGAQNIEAKKEYINELNVFPVPDGDTGTNMSMTIMAAAKEVTALEGMDMASLAKAISSGSLRGARGNSGVILSQLLRGFTKSIKTESEIDVPALARAAVRAKETAYKAVMKPKEGTILTVAKGVAEKAQTLAEETDDLEEFLPKLIEEAETVLAKTPDMLPVLKEAGVVDSGGQGLLEVLRGAYDAFLGKEIDYSALAPTPQAVNATKVETEGTVDIKFGYCTEFIILLDKEFTEKDEIEFKAYLESIGDSIVCVADEDVVKIHVHTNDPGLAIQKALTYGQLSRMKIDNMREEHQEKLIKDAEKLAAAQVEEDNQYAAMMKRIQYLYENGEVEYIDTLMSSASFTDMLNKSEYVEQISSYDQKQLNALIQTRQDIQDYEATLEKDLKEVESVKADLETEKDNLNTTITEKNNKIAEYSKDIDAQTAMVEQYQKEIDAADAEMAAIQKRLDEQRAAQQQSGGSSGSSEPQYYTPSGGSYMWPATQGSRISSYFGPRSSPTAGASSNHKGIDIPCPTGSDIVASAAGTVVVSQYSSSAGYYIMIDHGNGVSTVYMHNSQLVVSVGQSVEQGQVIAKAGSTGYSTGSHCHFGVMINGSYVNPLDYL